MPLLDSTTTSGRGSVRKVSDHGTGARDSKICVAPTQRQARRVPGLHDAGARREALQRHGHDGRGTGRVKLDWKTPPPPVAIASTADSW